MWEYDFVTIGTEYGTGWSPFGGGVRIDTQGHRAMIRQKALEGWRFEAAIPARQHASGQIDALDLVFEREKKE